MPLHYLVCCLQCKVADSQSELHISSCTLEQLAKTSLGFLYCVCTLQQKITALLATESRASMMLRTAGHCLDAWQGVAGNTLQDSNQRRPRIGACIPHADAA